MMARHKTSLDDTILSTLQRYEIQICPVYSLLINAKMHDILQNESIVKKSLGEKSQTTSIHFLSLD